MNDRHLYRFGEFELFADENELHRNGEGVPLTPKMYDMLRVLVRNHGQILDKDTLLKEVWPDSFVEEGNISFNIRQLRKALNDDVQAPLFIETVPRRGYRFIAEVEEVDPSSAPEQSDETRHPPASASLPATAVSRRRFVPGVTALSFFLLCAVVIGAWYLLARQNESGFRILSEEFSSEKLSTTGLVYAAAISPDGESVVYSSRQGTGQSVWLRQLSSASNIEIIPKSEGSYYFEIVFSPDGNSIYFSRGIDGVGGQINIFRVPREGGIPEKVISDTEGWLSLSADGEKISFVRCPYRDEEFCSLWVADAKNGNNERKLVSRPRPIRIGDNEISPDGTSIAFATGQSRNQANEFRLMAVGLQDGAEREITAERFFNVKSLAWLPDQSGLLITASRIPNKYFRIWRISSAGAAKPLTKDSETYSVLSLDKTAERLVATQIKQDFQAYRFDLNDPSKKQLLGVATNATFAPDGKVIFSSIKSGNDEIWGMNADGSGQRQLTNDAADDRQPIVSPDGKTIYFTSNRTGEAHVWSMEADGSGQTRVTQKEGGTPVFATRGGRTVYYRHAISGMLWSVSLENGEERIVLSNTDSDFAFSPDGALVAFVENPEKDPMLTVASTTDGQTAGRFKLPMHTAKLLQMAWLPDARTLVYILTDSESRNNQLYRQALDGTPPRSIADLGASEVNEVSGLAVSPDGKSFVLIQGGWKHDAVLMKGLQ